MGKASKVETGGATPKRRPFSFSHPRKRKSNADLRWAEAYSQVREEHPDATIEETMKLTRQRMGL